MGRDILYNHDKITVYKASEIAAKHTHNMYFHGFINF